MSNSVPISVNVNIKKKQWNLSEITEQMPLFLQMLALWIMDKQPLITGLLSTGICQLMPPPLSHSNTLHTAYIRQIQTSQSDPGSLTGSIVSQFLLKHQLITICVTDRCLLSNYRMFTNTQLTHCSLQTLTVFNQVPIYTCTYISGLTLKDDVESCTFTQHAFTWFGYICYAYSTTF